jgi:predicted alpha/beta-hydrolase family hydrolase
VSGAILVPGFNGTARQPMLVKLKRALKELGIPARAITLAPGRPTPELEPEVAQLRQMAKGAQALVGRSFGGRVCARLAVQRPPRALVLLGFPVRPPGKRRPLDEAALKALRCPTLILQGEDDELGPPALLRRLLKKNPKVTLEVISGAGHSFGRREAAVLARAAQWLSQQLERKGA